MNKTLFYPDISKDNIWKKGYNRLTSINIEENIAFFTNIRDFNHITNSLSYIDKKYNINDLNEIVLHSIPFGYKKIFSHLILEFQFTNSKSLFLSVEARRQPTEGFSIIKGLFKHFGIIYIWGTESDLIGLRKNIRKDKIFSYTLNLSKESKKKGFQYFINRTNKLKDTPEYYHSLVHNCVTNLYEGLKYHSNKNLKFGWELIFSASIKKYLVKYNYINK